VTNGSCCNVSGRDVARPSSETAARVAGRGVHKRDLRVVHRAGAWAATTTIIDAVFVECENTTETRQGKGAQSRDMIAECNS
jgi:hypothetical protein